MTRTDDVLNQIDTAVNDWTTSPDAMRSAPALSREPLCATQFTPEQIAQLRENWQAIGRAWAQAVRPAMENAAKAFAEFSRHLREAGLVDEDGKPTKRPDRPAWQSPYGPPRRR